MNVLMRMNTECFLRYNKLRANHATSPSSLQ